MTQDKRYTRISWAEPKPGGSPTNGTEGPAVPLEMVALLIQLELELSPPPTPTTRTVAS